MEVRPEDLAQFPVRRPVVTARNPDIPLCDEKVPILEVLRKYTGLDTGYRTKSRCPFAAEHQEGSETERCFQVYETNSGWCFQHRVSYTPTKLVSLVLGCSRTRAANILLDRYGLKRKLAFQERFGDVARWAEAQRPYGDVQELATMLSAELAANDVYAAVEFDDDVREEWDSCLTALDRLRKAGPDALRRWYAVCKTRLLAVAARRLTEVTQSRYDGVEEDEE